MTVRVVNAPPITPPRPIAIAGHGLAGLCERVQRLDGALAADVASDGGWALEAHLQHG